jgi:ABC-type molybdate transport system substrate-binding protein
MQSAPRRIPKRDLILLGGLFALLLLVPFVLFVIVIPSSVPLTTLSIYAAEPYGEAARQTWAAFERHNPTCRADLRVGAAAALATQIERGVPVDVFIRAENGQLTLTIPASARQWAGAAAFIAFAQSDPKSALLGR